MVFDDSRGPSKSLWISPAHHEGGFGRPNERPRPRKQTGRRPIHRLQDLLTWHLVFLAEWELIRKPVAWIVINKETMAVDWRPSSHIEGNALESGLNSTIFCFRNLRAVISWSRLDCDRRRSTFPTLLRSSLCLALEPSDVNKVLNYYVSRVRGFKRTWQKAQD